MNKFEDVTMAETSNSCYTLHDLYDILAGGSSVQMSFNSYVEAKQFQQKLGGCKHRQEKHLKNLGMIEHMTLSMQYNYETQIAEFKLKPPESKPRKTYEILAITPPTAEI